MIKAQDNALADVDVLAVSHYDNLIAPLNADGVTYHATHSLIGRIASGRAADAAAGDADRVAFWDYFLSSNYQNLRRVITGRPGVLKQIIQDIDGRFGADFLSDRIDYEQAELTDFGKIVKAKFEYKTLYRNHPECEANCREINFIYCPYCNENTVPVIVRTNGLTGHQEDMALLQIDHFYPRVRFPYLGLSFFNLIPGCSPCNGPLKGDKDFDISTHFNPFHKRLDDFVAFRLKNVAPKDATEIQIEYKSKVLTAHSDSALRDFELVERYERSHRTQLFKLARTIRMHKPRVVYELKWQLPFVFRVLDENITTLIENHGVPLNRNEINDYALGKLKRDICVQMGAL
jgi:hypothetical protein